MPRLEIFVKTGCFGCEEAHRLWQAVARLPEVDARLVDIETVRSLPERVVAVPTYLLDGNVVSLGNPEPHALFARLAMAVFSGRAPLLVASGALVGNLLLGLVLLVFGGICLSVGTLQLEVPVNPALLSLAGLGALAGAAVLVTHVIWELRHPLVLSDEGLRLGRTRIRWADIVAVQERAERDGELEVRDRDGRRLRLARRHLDSRTYAELHRWLLALTESPGGTSPASPLRDRPDGLSVEEPDVLAP
jgi:hypothetical protein